MGTQPHSEYHEDIPYWIAFNSLSEFGSKRIQKLLNYFSSLSQAWHAPIAELVHAGIEQKIAEVYATKRTRIHPHKEYEKVMQHGISVLTLQHKDYPALLKEITNPPPVIYYRGAVSENDSRAVAIVGTRKITPYGTHVTSHIAGELARHGIPVISGLALGVDACAHRSCLDSNGRTIAVLAHGLDHIYPTANTRLAHEILEHKGLLLSEFHIGTESYKSNFPQRNRIISGLSKAVIVVEAAEKSGSLITAHHALDQNREVCAIPGPLFSEQSVGCNELIKNGAHVITNAQDILDILQFSPIHIPHRNTHTATSDEACVLKLLSAHSHTSDDIIKHTNLDAKKIHSILVTMELKGFIKAMGNGYYIKL